MCIWLIQHKGFVLLVAFDLRDVDEAAVCEVYTYSSVGVDVSQCSFDGGLVRVYP